MKLTVRRLPSDYQAANQRWALAAQDALASSMFQVNSDLALGP